jgi:hypothetical protein
MTNVINTKCNVCVCTYVYKEQQFKEQAVPKAKETTKGAEHNHRTPIIIYLKLH